MQKDRIQITKTNVLSGSQLYEIRIKDSVRPFEERTFTREELAGSIASMLILGATHSGFVGLHDAILKEFPRLVREDIGLAIRNIQYSAERRIKAKEVPDDIMDLCRSVSGVLDKMQIDGMFKKQVSDILISYGAARLDRFYDSVIGNIPHPLD